MIVSEVFGPTVQGEGPTTGRRCAFVRLGQCNLRCRWCDTPYTWDWKGITGTTYDPKAELETLEPAAVAAQLAGMGVDMVVISGGEPLLQQPALAKLVKLLPQTMRVEVETNGTRVPVAPLIERVWFNVSPKLAHSGDPERRRIVPAALESLQATGRSVWKFVAATPAHLDEVQTVVSRFSLAPVYVMPLGVTRTDVSERLSSLADHVIARGWNLTTRMHVDVWNGQRAK